MADGCEETCANSGTETLTPKICTKKRLNPITNFLRLVEGSEHTFVVCLEAYDEVFSIIFGSCWRLWNLLVLAESVSCCHISACPHLVAHLLMHFPFVVSAAQHLGRRCASGPAAVPGVRADRRPATARTVRTCCFFLLFCRALPLAVHAHTSARAFF